MITDEASLKEELKIMNAMILNAIVMFESKAGAGLKVSLKWSGLGQNEFIIDDIVWVVNSSADMKVIDTGVVTNVITGES